MMDRVASALPYSNASAFQKSARRFAASGPGHPAWYYNLRANPEVEVAGVRRSFRAVATTYERRASHRRIAVFILGPPWPSA
jgi:hypothetical protein